MDNLEELCFEGCNFMRQRLTYSVLSGRPITIQEIRAKDDEPGLKGALFCTSKNYWLLINELRRLISALKYCPPVTFYERRAVL